MGGGSKSHKKPVSGKDRKTIPSILRNANLIVQIKTNSIAHLCTVNIFHISPLFNMAYKLLLTLLQFSGAMGHAGELGYDGYTWPPPPSPISPSLQSQSLPSTVRCPVWVWALCGCGCVFAVCKKTKRCRKPKAGRKAGVKSEDKKQIKNKEGNK